jgi:uncharacterized protein YceK
MSLSGCGTVEVGNTTGTDKIWHMARHLGVLDLPF